MGHNNKTEAIMVTKHTLSLFYIFNTPFFKLQGQMLKFISQTKKTPKKCTIPLLHILFNKGMTLIFQNEIS